MATQQRSHKLPRIGAATAITVAGGTVMIGGQPVVAADLVVTTDSGVFDGTGGDPDGADDELSLADAVYAANQTPDLDTITFAIPGPGPHVIDVAGALPWIMEDLVITGPGADQLTLTNSNGSAIYVYNEADVTLSGFTISAPALGGVPAMGIDVVEGGITTIRDVDIDQVDRGVWVENSGAAVFEVIIENVTVDDASTFAVDIGDAQMLSVDGLTITNSTAGVFLLATATASITGLDVTGGLSGLYASHVDDLDLDGATIDGATTSAVFALDTADTAISGVTITGGNNGVVVDSTAPGVGVVAVSDSVFSGQAGTSIDVNQIAELDVDTTTIDTPGAVGVDASTVTTLTITESDVTESHEAAVRLVNVDSADLADVTAVRTLGGLAANAGAVFGNGVASFDLADVTVSGATGGAVVVAGSGTVTATGLELTGNDNGVRLKGPGGSVTDSVISGNTFAGMTTSTGTETLSITNTEISDNGTVGVYLADTGPMEADGVTIERNGLVDASPLGGVHFAGDATPDVSRIVNSTISGNEGGLGGGVSVDDSDSIVLLHTVTLEGNSAPFGDALAIRGDVDGGGEINVGNSSITGHTGVASELFASQNGLIQMYGSTIDANAGSSVVESVGDGDVAVQLSEITSNDASASLIRASGGAVDIDTSTVTDNTARTLVEAEGSGAVNVTQSTLTQNTAVDALVAADTSGAVELAFATVTDNSLTDAASTVFEHDGSGVFQVDSSILAGNTVLGWVDAPLAAPDPEVDYSLIPVVSGSDVDGANNIVTDDPELGPLQNNDGPTPTMLPDKGSPAIDAANPTPPDPPSSDQRGLEREVNGRSDIGSVERQLSPFVIGLPPARVLETRTGPTYKTIDGEDEGIGRRTNGQETMLQIAGRAGVPADAEAVVINVTGVDPDGVGFVTVHPCLVNPPLASSLNFRGDVDSGNEIVAELTADGKLCLFNRGVTDLVVDVVGYVPNDSRYSPVGPARLLDTRDTGATIDGLFEKGGTRLSDTELELDVAGRGGVSSDATAVVINVTAVKPTGIGYVTVHPCLPTEPNAASLNFEAGVNRGNEIVAELDDDGKLCLYTWGSAELIVDVVGQLTDENTYDTVPPARLYETRSAPNGTIDDRQEDQGRLDAREVVTVEAAGRAGVPADAKGVVVNTTAIRTANRGFLTVWDCTGTMPLAASLNYTTGEIVGNELVVELNADGEFCVFSNRATDLTVDVVGYLS
ncbi:right-handed parallel beta-helix repeat-containing protein [Ilumatobacter coccineus]|uniref:Right handed beta helix domain-containing protein n=1 Tax=Ilumatobacter coccineus (strain NBRC 103263 / KCTC 29153 / YM16-304) TaxID=1313172 RepID=A0A6C7EJ39_ILUCY|nr:right-handed parallel beta-helix repeat-containing protein [Ilumatobacter coccineus]BAN03986.1 hypothetical protein YM304_36720 [Ilumatobacter coccineus YM16-304]